MPVNSDTSPIGDPSDASKPLETLLYEVKNGVAYVTLNRPERRNGISGQMQAELEIAVNQADYNDAVKVIVLRGSGPSFCSGYDIGGGTASAKTEWALLHKNIYRWRRDGEWWIKLFWNLRKPVVAQVQGTCAAGANDLIAAVDIVIAAEDAKFSLPQARGIGVIHTMGLWPYYLGARKSKELAFTGDPISGIEAERLGLVNKAVPADELEAETTWFAERVALMPRELLMAHKFAINRFFDGAGVEASVRGAGEYDSIGARNSMSEEFVQRAARDGVKAAVAWRDGIWADQAKARPAKRRKS